jgi:NMD protein affecting ribosome stability and mRNA decay
MIVDFADGDERIACCKCGRLFEAFRSNVCYVCDPNQDDDTDDPEDIDDDIDDDDL